MKTNPTYQQALSVRATIATAAKLAAVLLALASTLAIRGSTFTVVNTSDGGPGSLRDAILDANATPGTDTITFNLPGAGPFSIQPVTELPTITDPVVIDAATQPGFAGAPLIELNGALAAGPANGLKIQSGDSTVRGLAINRWSAFGVLLTGGGNNRIEGNFVGTDLTGTAAAGNPGGVGILDSNDNVIGGLAAAARNVISGNLGTGVQIEPGARNRIIGNFIGPDVTGAVALPNSVRAGVFISFGEGNIVGGTSLAERNVISGNNQHGIEIGGVNSQPNVVQGNLIGTDVTGTLAVPNLNGINSNSSSSQQIGGTIPGAGNVISGNISYGVGVNGGLVEGNLIGTDHTGTLALGNGDGVFLGAGVTLGGNTAPARNIISGNLHYGVAMFGAGSGGSFVRGNFIGTDVTGTVAIGNGEGVSAQQNPVGNTIGGSNPGEGNLISGNHVGVDLRSADNVVQGNLIGTDVTGTAALGNVLGIALYVGAQNNLIGGAGVGAGNVISGNTHRGIAFHGASGNRIHGNIIGADVSGTAPLGNTEGVMIVDASANEIGGVNPGEGNLIAHSAAAGVYVWSLGPPGSTVGNAIRGNSIHSNGGLGIDLGVNGPTPNDCLDADVGENFRQNFPIILSASTGGGSTTIHGTLHSTPNTAFQIELFANNACDPGGRNEGEIFLGTTAVMTSGQGNVAFMVTFPTDVPSVQCLTATATDSDGNTSEFSANLNDNCAPDSEPPVVTCPPGISVPLHDVPPAATSAAEFIAQGGTITDNRDPSPSVSSSDTVSGHCPMLITRTYTVTDASGNASTCEQIITVENLFAADSIIWHQPLARNGASEDTDPSAGGTLKYRFKLGSTIPIKIHAQGCGGTDVTGNANVMGTVEVFGDTNCDGVADGNALAIDYNGVGETGGVMDKIGGHLKYNLDTKKLPQTTQCYILQVTVTDTSTGESRSEIVPLQAK